MSMLKENKKKMRKKMRTILNSISYSERMDSGEIIASKLSLWLNSIHNLKNKNINIGFFANLDDEIDTTHLDLVLMKMNCNRFLPVIKENSLFWKQIPEHVNIANLKAGYFNIPEPPDDSLQINLSKLDVLIIPGLAFDKKGNRLGRGKGFYDKILSTIKKNNIKPIKIGLSLDCQIVDKVFIEYFDKPVEWLCTPLYGIRNVI